MTRKYSLVCAHILARREAVRVLGSDLWVRFIRGPMLMECSFGSCELPFAAAERHAWMTPVSRPHHETLIRRRSNMSAIPPIPTAK